MKKIFVIFVFSFIFLSGRAQSDQLDPFVLPESSHRQQNQMQQNQDSISPQEENPLIDESVYEAFEVEASKLNKKEKMALSSSFQEKQKKAMEKEDWSEVKHYQRLLNILKPKN